MVIIIKTRSKNNRRLLASPHLCIWDLRCGLWVLGSGILGTDWVTFPNPNPNAKPNPFSSNSNTNVGQTKWAGPGLNLGWVGWLNVFISSMYSVLVDGTARNMRCNQNRLKNYTLIELEVRGGFELADGSKGPPRYWWHNKERWQRHVKPTMPQAATRWMDG